MQAVSFEVAWASRLLPHASLWLSMFEMHPSRGGVPDFGSDPAYGGMTFSLSHKRSHRNQVWNGRNPILACIRHVPGRHTDSFYRSVVKVTYAGNAWRVVLLWRLIGSEWRQLYAGVCAMDCGVPIC